MSSLNNEILAVLKALDQQGALKHLWVNKKAPDFSGALSVGGLSDLPSGSRL